MDVKFKIFLLLHILGGSVGLLTGILNIIQKKGDKKHRLIGKIFYFSMLTAGFSSLILAYLHPNYFLFMVGVFTLYMVGSGDRYLKHRNTNNNEIQILDWAISILMLLAGLFFIGMGAFNLFKSNFFGLVFIVFGGLGLFFVNQDFKNFRGKSSIQNYWLIGHLQRMTGGFIAAFTAFLVVNSENLPNQIPGFVYWLLPTFLLAPLISKWSRKFKIKKT